MDVQFSEEQPVRRVSASATPRTGLGALLIRWGFAKDASQANMVLLGVVVLLIIVSLWLFISSKVQPGSTSIEQIKQTSQNQAQFYGK